MARSRIDLAPGHPALHLAPPKGWMNDPNGLSYLDGTWHAFYQHHPDDDVWGPMHWRHATSPDLLHWDDKGIALWPSPKGAIFSGTLVVDHDDTAGFGAGRRVAVFTLSGDEGQRQGIAHSADAVNWTMFDGNPVLVDGDESDFRDPKVFWFDDHWVMALAVGHHVRFYRSANLTDWEQVGAYRPSRPVIGTIECPDLVPITTTTGTEGYVLIYGDDRGAVDEHSGTMAVAGSFDGSTFQEWALPQLLDHGPDFYAAQSFAEAPVVEPVLLGWMNSWRYANQHPSAGRRGVLSLPRSVWVESRDDALVRTRLGVDLASVPSTVGAGSWASSPDAALLVTVQNGGLRLRVGADDQAGAITGDRGRDIAGDVLGDTDGGVVDVTVADGAVSIVRGDIGLQHFAISVELDDAPGAVQFVLDHGTLEAFLPDGRSVSLLTFAGASWTVDLRGDATGAVLS